MYVNPTNRNMFLVTITCADKNIVSSLLANSLAISLGVDGNVHKYRMDNKFVMAKVVILDDSDELIFLGLEEPLERKENGTVFCYIFTGLFVVWWRVEATGEGIA